MSNQFRSTYTAHYRPPSAYEHSNVLAETGIDIPTPTYRSPGFHTEKLSPTTGSPKSPKYKPRSNTSQILSPPGKPLVQPTSTFKTEYIRSYSPPREKLEASSPTKTRNRSSPNSASYSSPSQTLNNENTATSNENYYDPANTGVGTPVGPDRGNFDNTTELGQSQTQNQTKPLKPQFITEYARRYSPPRAKIHTNPNDLEATANAERAYFPPNQYKGRHSGHNAGESQPLGDSQNLGESQNLGGSWGGGGSANGQDLGETHGWGGDDTQGAGADGARERAFLTQPLSGTAQGQTPPRPGSGSSRGSPGGSGGSPGGSGSKGRRGRESGGLVLGGSVDGVKSPYYKTEYIRQYSPPRDKKLKPDNL